MMTRRDVLRGAMTAGAAALAGRPAVTFAKASQPSTPVDFAIPEGACDCHVHTFDPQHFPYAPSRPYTPEPVSVGAVMVACWSGSCRASYSRATERALLRKAGCAVMSRTRSP